MSSGLFALLDDIVVLARAAATSLDDVALGASKAASKSVAVIVDDAAVTPKYVVGLSPKRELPVIWKITLGSLKNKFIFIIPAAMILSWLAPWMLPYFLILGGAYLCFEGSEKVLTWMRLLKAHDEKAIAGAGTELERKMVNSAVRTDLILSTEIMLISLAAVDEDNWIMKLLMLCLIGLAMTALVYGAVAILVKLDDVGLYLASKKNQLAQTFGRGLVKVMPSIFTTLTIVGTLAMLWVGGHLVWKSLGDVGVPIFESSLYAVEGFFHTWGGIFAWLGNTSVSIIFGMIVGVLVFVFAHPISNFLKNRSNKIAIESTSVSLDRGRA